MLFVLNWDSFLGNIDNKILFCLFFLVSLGIGLISVSAQQEKFASSNKLINLPYHIDPNSKIEAPEQSLVPAIRFLTSADFFPFNYRDNSGRLVGFNIDLATEICTLLDIACTMQAWPWDQIKGALKDNQGDALIAGLAINNESAKQFDFSNIYLMLPARFVVKQANLDSFDANNLANKKIAVRENSAHAKFLRRYFTNIEQLTFDSEIKALTAIKEGSAFAYFGDAMHASFWLNENIDCCAFAGNPYFNANYFGQGMSIALPIKHDAVRNAINYSLVQLKRNGKLDELYLRWFPISFY